MEKEFERLDTEWNLASNAEVVAIKAERYYYRHDPANACRCAMRFACLLTTSRAATTNTSRTAMYTCHHRVRELDPFLAPNLPVYLSCLVEMKRKSELFHTAHQVPAVSRAHRMD